MREKNNHPFIVLLLCIICFMSGNLASDWLNLKALKDFDYADRESADVTADDRVYTLPDKTRESEKIQNSRYMALQKQQDYSFAYNQLDAAEKNLYLAMLDSIYEYNNQTLLENTDKDAVGKVFQCILNDHPEIFYIDGYSFTEIKAAENIINIKFSPIYNMTRDEADSALEIIEEKTDEFIRSIPAQAGEYEKVKAVYEYLINNTEYDFAARDNQNICSVFLYGKSVCQGYAKATQYLLQKCGVVSTLVLGEIVGGSAHAWNLVRVDGAYYYVDTTWGDSSYQIDLQNPDIEVPSLDINYDYLCVTTEQLSKTHIIGNVVGLPQCTSLMANYYVKENTYFTEYDESKIREAFESAIAKNQDVLTLKASDFGTYTQMRNALIVRKQVFAFIPDDMADNIIYLDNENQYSITFWLTK